MSAGAKKKREGQDPSVWVGNNFNKHKADVQNRHIGRSSNNSEYVEQPGQSAERQVLAVSGLPGSRNRQRLGLGVSDGNRYFEVVSEAHQPCLRMRNLEDESNMLRGSREKRAAWRLYSDTSCQSLPTQQ